MSYGAGYYHATFYEGEEEFSGTMTFYSDNTVVVRNTTFGEDIKFFITTKMAMSFSW